MDKRLVDVCNALTPALLSGEVRINRGTRVQVERRDRLLMHLYQHQIHHRGQAHGMRLHLLLVWLRCHLVLRKGTSSAVRQNESRRRESQDATVH